MWFKLQTHIFNCRFVEELVFPLLSAQIRSDVSLPWEDSMFQMSTPAHIYFLQLQSCWAQPVTRPAVILPVWLKNKGQFLAKPLVRPKTLSDRFDSLAHGACSLKRGRVAVLFLHLVQQRCLIWDIHMMCDAWGRDSSSMGIVFIYSGTVKQFRRGLRAENSLNHIQGGPSIQVKHMGFTTQRPHYCT